MFKKLIAAFCQGFMAECFPAEVEPPRYYPLEALIGTPSNPTIPKIEVQFEQKSGMITHSKSTDKFRVEHQDDGTLSVIIDAWPQDEVIDDT